MAETGAERLLRDLAAAFAGTLAPLGMGLVADSREPEVGHEHLLQPAQVAAILAWFDNRLNTRMDRRPALSIWTGWHFQSVLPAIFAANILLDRTPRLALDQVGFLISNDHRADRLRIARDVDEIGEREDLDRFAPLVWSYLAPLIALIARRTSVTERVLWSNAGHVLERLLAVFATRAEARPGGARPGLIAAQRLFAAPVWPDGRRNPLFQPVVYLDGRRIRRICCMRYLFPDGKICTVCPIRLQGTDRQPVHD